MLGTLTFNIRALTDQLVDGSVAAFLPVKMH
jgi:hypothetical protein